MADIRRSEGTGPAARGEGLSPDTIYALSSGAPPAGIAVLRLSGPRVRFGLETLVGPLPPPRRATLRTIRDPQTGEGIDRGLVLFFPAPESFTGEDCGELHLHGGRAVVAAVLRALGGIRGFRAAERGEFTRRAFASGRLDLTEAEGLADLVAAETEGQRRLALRQADGTLRRQAEDWRARLIQFRARAEAMLDFAEEEDAAGAWTDRERRAVAAVADEIAAAIAEGARGERLRDGAEIVLLGAPNAGKSSLLNALARRDVAIVSPEPGTTRDAIEVRVDLDGLAATLVDTAGLREAEGAVEREGVRRAWRRAEEADLVVWLTEPGDRGTPPEAGERLIRVASKADLMDSGAEQALRRLGLLPVSAVTGAGLAELMGAIGARLAARLGGEPPLVTRARHREALGACEAALREAATGGPGALELTADALRRATDALGRLTGRVDVEQVLDAVFQDFCIGK